MVHSIVLKFEKIWFERYFNYYPETKNVTYGRTNERTDGHEDPYILPTLVKTQISNLGRTTYFWNVSYYIFKYQLMFVLLVEQKLLTHPARLISTQVISGFMLPRLQFSVQFLFFRPLFLLFLLVILFSVLQFKFLITPLVS